ncbi:hypothetical protein F4778DRAFT_483224 [Xylariomycetidae sp. FL2044]|nr:hypothetical protein F4778DRAFT_483224 [Xylariomycetidae sp. FL2044]
MAPVTRSKARRKPVAKTRMKKVTKLAWVQRSSLRRAIQESVRYAVASGIPVPSRQPSPGRTKPDDDMLDMDNNPSSSSLSSLPTSLPLPTSLESPDIPSTLSSIPPVSSAISPTSTSSSHAAPAAAVSAPSALKRKEEAQNSRGARRRLSETDEATKASTREDRRQSRAVIRQDNGAPPLGIAGWYRIRQITNEVRMLGNLVYLVEWEGTNPMTGVGWPASWVDAEDVSEFAIREWEKVK